MKKIYLSILSIVATVGIVSGAAYALFSDTVTVSGLTVSTGNADLQINVMDTNLPDYYKDSISSSDLGGFTIPSLYPGFRNDEKFWLRNNSTTGFYLRPSVKLTSPGGNWDALKDVIEIKITDITDPAKYSWEWRPLSWWNSEDRTISNTPGLANGNDNAHQYQIEVRIPSSADNTIKNKNLSNVTFVITGTQVNP